MPNPNRWRTGLRMDGLGPPRPHATLVSRAVVSSQVELPTDSVRVLEGDVVLVESGVELHARPSLQISIPSATLSAAQESGSASLRTIDS